MNRYLTTYEIQTHVDCWVRGQSIELSEDWSVVPDALLGAMAVQS